jgi:hypothetical protein
MKRPVITQVKSEEWSPDQIIAGDAGGGIHGETSLRSSLITRSTPQTKTNIDLSFVVTLPLLASD